jgi:hypothetical protein
MVQRELKIVRLMNPTMCLGCAFAKIADVEDEMGFKSRMIQCRRLDCDNWDTSDAAPVRSVTSLEDAP